MSEESRDKQIEELKTHIETLWDNLEECRDLRDRLQGEIKELKRKVDAKVVSERSLEMKKPQLPVQPWDVSDYLLWLTEMVEKPDVKLPEKQPEKRMVELARVIEEVREWADKWRFIEAAPDMQDLIKRLENL